MSATEKVRQFLSENPGAVVNGRWVTEMLAEYDRLELESRRLRSQIVTGGRDWRTRAQREKT